VRIVSRLNRPHARRALPRPAFLAAVLVLSVSAAPALAASTPGADQAAFSRVRAATAAYHDLAVAQAAGYGLFPGCFSDPTGGMGVHYVDFGSVGDGTVDPFEPEALVYEPLAGGEVRLVAVEYVMIAASWQGQGVPTVLGHALTFVPAPNEFGLPDFYELHVWLWQPNPLGTFNEWNPTVSCPNI
jgi:hypothetical protein